jgi:hypothetical protein
VVGAVGVGASRLNPERHRLIEKNRRDKTNGLLEQIRGVLSLPSDVKKATILEHALAIIKVRVASRSLDAPTF